MATSYKGNGGCQRAAARQNFSVVFLIVVSCGAGSASQSTHFPRSCHASVGTLQPEFDCLAVHCLVISACMLQISIELPTWVVFGARAVVAPFLLMYETLP